ncbi:2Fe-2S iron-sulfur cluster-binding protein [[Mycobacterium] nativiensis]|uniref:2Fe-2S iron-sulfur cluster-binding protein n=1 Tax=[Mycobacterium] nativiensis TaxID=2855503 RepID=UPI001CD6032E
MPAEKHWVTVEPRHIVLEADDGETIMGAALRSGYRWPSLCGGDGTCSICWVEVLTGGNQLSEVGELEQDTLQLVPALVRRTRSVRLACQARVQGDVCVRKSGVRPKAQQ